MDSSTKGEAKMFKIKVRAYGAWSDFKKVYGSAEPALFKTKEDAQQVASDWAKMYEGLYRVVPA